MSGGDKKKWSTPKLRVFVRTRTEEMVLAYCKTGSGTLINSSKTAFGACFVNERCTACASQVGS
jgi:hypothetical protein